MAELFSQKLVWYLDQGKLLLHAFVVMPNQIPLLLTVPEGLILERVMRFIKGGFSHEAGNSLGIHAPFWQKSFVDRRVRDSSECARFISYIHENPVRAGLVLSARQFRCSSLNPVFLLDGLPRRLKPMAE